MRVLRTVTIENSAATKKPLAQTSASSPASRHSVAASECSMAGILRFSIAEEVRVDEVIDDRLVGGIDDLELDAHADAAIAPRHVPLGVDVLLRSGHAEADLDLRRTLERAGRPDGDAAVAEVQRQRCRNRVAEPVLNRNAQHHARAAAAVEVVGKQVRRQRRQNVLHRAVLVDVAGDAERRKLAYFVRVGDRAAENQQRQLALVKLADRPNQLDARRVRQTPIDDDEIDLCEVGANTRQQLDGAAHEDRFVACLFDCRAETITHERSVVGDDDGLRGDRGTGHRFRYRNHASRALPRVAELRRFSLYSRVSRRCGILSDRRPEWPPARNAMPKSKSTSSMSTRAISSVALSVAPISKWSACLRWSWTSRPRTTTISTTTMRKTTRKTTTSRMTTTMMMTTTR